MGLFVFSNGAALTLPVFDGIRKLVKAETPGSSFVTLDKKRRVQMTVYAHEGETGEPNAFLPHFQGDIFIVQERGSEEVAIDVEQIPKVWRESR